MNRVLIFYICQDLLVFGFCQTWCLSHTPHIRVGSDFCSFGAGSHTVSREQPGLFMLNILYYFAGTVRSIKYDTYDICAFYCFFVCLCQVMDRLSQSVPKEQGTIVLLLASSLTVLKSCLLWLIVIDTWTGRTFPSFQIHLLLSVHHLLLFFQHFSPQDSTKYQGSQLRFLLALSPVNKPAPAISNESLPTIVNSQARQQGAPRDFCTDVCKQGTLCLWQRAPTIISQSIRFLSLLVLQVAARWAHLSPSQRSSQGSCPDTNKIFGRRTVCLFLLRVDGRLTKNNG